MTEDNVVDVEAKCPYQIESLTVRPTLVTTDTTTFGKRQRAAWSTPVALILLIAAEPRALQAVMP